jgi:D-alanine transaminase
MTENGAIVYLNGQFLPLEQAFVPVLDPGFIFGDGVYEVIPVYGSPGPVWRHMNRLYQDYKRRLIAGEVE